jgi:hypothetical protein
VLSPPLADAAATGHESPRKFLIATKNRTIVANPQNSASMSSSSMTLPWTVKDVSIMATDNRALQRFLYSQMARKNMGAYDQIPSDPANSRHEAPTGVRRWSLPELDTPSRSMRADIN